MRAEFYMAMADAILVTHLLFIAWAIFGALLTRGRLRLAILHVATLVYGIIVETTPLVCPLTLAENWCEVRAGVLPYHGPFLLHYLDATVYPNLPASLLVACGVIVCVANLGVYALRLHAHHRGRLRV